MLKTSKMFKELFELTGFYCKIVCIKYLQVQVEHVAEHLYSSTVLEVKRSVSD